ncbi:hypothetical protein FB45DRAFT_938289 [Roridomyces roridus]|uniref:C2H2-type domain-containing protein n=1 Tax=Roridomyces roridus TaxID=1738132 RepID=A0AAD7FB52_9AGAR|nr:hypothetical protein FB45DRAFT_938289 [Roridomyces roridus]
MEPTKKRRPSSTGPPRKHHICTVCQRGFSTTGHLARHSRVHTGERNHKCPFPGCETKCSRQDNLQQHYRIHLSPGSRRKSGRSIPILRSRSTPAPSPRAASASPPSGSSEDYGCREDSPPLEPPPLEDSRVYFRKLALAQGAALDTPPESPPPLVEASLPTTASSPSIGLPSHRMLPPLDTSTGSYGWHTAPSSASAAYQYDYGSAATSPALSPVVSSASTSYSSLASTAAWESPQRAYPPFRAASHSPAAMAVPVSRLATGSIHQGAYEAGGSLSPPDGRSPQTPYTPYTYPATEPPSCYTLPTEPQTESPQTAYPYGQYSSAGEQQQYQYPAAYDGQGHIIAGSANAGYTAVPTMEYRASAQTSYSPSPVLSSLPSIQRRPGPTRRDSYAQYHEYSYSTGHGYAPTPVLHQPRPQYHLPVYQSGLVVQ